jgi:hypothetical protein
MVVSIGPVSWNTILKIGMEIEGQTSYHSIMTTGVLRWLVFQHLPYLPFAN